MTSLRIATRGSALARWQAELVASRLRQAHRELEVEVVTVVTEGDRRVDLPVWALAGRGVFVKEVQVAVLEERADVAVHSAKDLPSTTGPGLALAAFVERGDARDALVGAGLAQLAPGALVATGSVRRRAQLAWWRPDLTFTGLRGNVMTRLSKVPPGGAVVVAAAALRRLGAIDRAAEVLSPATMVPQVGQGAIAVECRAGDDRAAGSLAALDHAPTRRAVTAERAFLARLGGGCDLPAGAHAAPGQGLEGLVASLDGRVVLRERRPLDEHDDPAAVGREVAERLLAAGAGDVLAGAEGGPNG